MQYITKLYDRLDKICFARYGSDNNQIVEWIIGQNPGIENYQIVLPQGITINLPDPPNPVDPVPLKKPIYLWN
jgi:phage tail protein X